MKFKGNPFTDHKSGNTYNRLLIRPKAKSSAETESGVLIPGEVFNIVESGIVVSVCEGSSLKIGDEVVYAKVNREDKEQYDHVVIDNDELDSVYENEIWSVNEKPHNRLFISPLSDVEVTASDVVIPQEMKGIPQKGVVHMAPEGSFFKTGDIIQYRKQEQAIYPSVNLDGANFEVLWETDVFTVNGKVSPYRIIIKIDLRDQGLKRSATQGGVAMSPLFQFMLYNLQYGEVMDIGEEAQKNYPQLAVGDLAIIHHTIESQPHRILSYQMSKYSIITHELRMIDSFNPRSREIFGKINKAKLANKITTDVIVPFDKNIFLKWHIDLHEGEDERKRMSGLLEDDDFSLTKLHNIDDLRNTIAKKQKTGADLYKSKYQAHMTQLSRLNPEDQKNQENIQMFERGIEQLRMQAEKVTAYINKNHVLMCKIAFPMMVTSRMVLVTYRELYPISLFGSQYLIANERFILAHIKKQDNMPTVITPKGDMVLVLPIKDEGRGTVLVPETSKEIPFKGKVIAIGEKVEAIEKGDTILFKRNSGIEVDVDGVKHLIMVENSILCTVDDVPVA